MNAVAGLTARERRALRMLLSRSAIFIDGHWRVRGAPAPKLCPFALSTLAGIGMLRHVRRQVGGAQVVMLSGQGRAAAEALIDWSLPPRLARA